MASVTVDSVLRNYINDATSVVDILRLLQSVNIEDLRTFAHTQIGKMDSDQKRSLHLIALPMDNVLHRDVIQDILSFSDYSENIDCRFVCRQWNELCKLNEARMLREVYDRFNEEYPDPLPRGNNTWIWHGGRDKLHSIEKGLGFKGMLIDTYDVIKYCKSGDRVLVHEAGGFRSLEFCSLRPAEIVNDAHFIGVSPNRQSRISFTNTICSDHIILTLDHLTVDINAEEIGKAELKMSHCNIQCGPGIVVGRYSVLDLEHCELTQSSCSRMGPGKLSVIKVSPHANDVNICECTIIGVERGITIQDGIVDIDLSDDDDDLVDIKITNNVFEKISEYAVVESTRADMNEQPQIIGTEQCILSGNTSSLPTLQPNTLLHVEDQAVDDWWADARSSVSPF